MGHGGLERLCGFGRAALVSNTSETRNFCGTAGYVSPEMAQSARHHGVPKVCCLCCASAAKPLLPQSHRVDRPGPATRLGSQRLRALWRRAESLRTSDVLGVGMVWLDALAGCASCMHVPPI